MNGEQLNRETLELIKQVHRMSGEVKTSIASLHERDVKLEKKLDEVLKEIPKIEQNSKAIESHIKGHDIRFRKTVMIITIIIAIVNLLTSVIIKSFDKQNIITQSQEINK